MSRPSRQSEAPLDSAEDIAAVVSFLGTLSLLGAIGFGLYFIVIDVRDEFFPSLAPKPLPPRPGLRPKAPATTQPPTLFDSDDVV